MTEHARDPAQEPVDTAAADPDGIQPDVPQDATWIPDDGEEVDEW